VFEGIAGEAEHGVSDAPGGAIIHDTRLLG
jgi:hypothetical protein